MLDKINKNRLIIWSVVKLTMQESVPESMNAGLVYTRDIIRFRAVKQLSDMFWLTVLEESAPHVYQTYTNELVDDRCPQLISIINSFVEGEKSFTNLLVEGNTVLDEWCRSNGKLRVSMPNYNRTKYARDIFMKQCWNGIIVYEFRRDRLIVKPHSIRNIFYEKYVFWNTGVTETGLNFRAWTAMHNDSEVSVMDVILGKINHNPDVMRAINTALECYYSNFIYMITTLIHMVEQGILVNDCARFIILLIHKLRLQVINN